EKAAWPRDVRAHYAVRAFADDVDRRRRSADDAIFLGGPAELEQAKAHYEEAVAQYTAIAAAGKVLSDAFRQCDRASCELLDLAQSIDLAMRFSDSEETANSGAALLDAIDKTHRLRDGLDELVQDGDRRAADDLGGRPLDADELQRRADDLARSAVELAEELRSLTAQHKAALTKGPPAFWDLSFSPTPAVLGVDNVLKRFYDLFAADARLTPGPLAQDERTKARNEWKNLPGTGLSKNDGKETVNSGAPKSDEPRLPRWSKHPATAILRLATEPLTRPSAYDELRETFHTQGTKVVEPLARFGEGPQPPTGGSAKPQEASDLPDVAPPQSAMAARKRLADDEAGILAAAALLVEYSDGRESFVPRALRLPHFDQASFLTWQARRAVDDYWGPHAWRPETGGGAGGTEAAPYYRRLARALLKEAATIKERTDWKVEQSPDAKFVLAKVLDDRYQFTLDLSNPEASDKDDEDSASADVKWWYTFEPAPDAGLAALFVLGGDGTAANEPARPSDARLREAVDLSESQHRERMNRFTHVAAESTLRLYFRGHVAENEIGPARKRPRREIRHVLAKRGEATIRVRREAPFDLQVVFLLDCSGSMQVDTNGMPAFLSGQRITRMEAAKESLASLLEGLADQQGVEVGISLFGATYHTQAKRKSQWVEEIAAEAARQGLEITSGNDILSIAPLNVWSSKEFQNFKARYLSRIVARGQTPLYFAIAEAVRREFPREIAAKRQLLVIISDGENYVENDPHAEMTKSPRQAIDELDARKWLEVYVLNCGDDAGTQGKLTKEVFDKLDRLRPKPQVFPNPPADLDEFSARLRDAVRVPQYEYAVFNPAKPAAPGRRIWLGQKKGIKISSRTPYELFEADRFGRDRSRRFLVEGGENLIWWLSASGSGLEAQRLKKYENVAERAQRGKVPNPFFGHVPDVDLNPATFQVVAGEPVRNGAGDLEFRIAIENGDPKAFSPRPVESWIEIKPRRGEGAEPDVLKDTPYQFCDATYDQDDTGAPVLICKAPDWPHDAGEAEIRAWWSLEEEFDPAVREPIDQTVDKLIRSPPRVFATDEAGQQVSITVESPPRKIGDLGASVIVTQEQQPADAGFRPMRVHSVDPPDETIRRYFPATGKRGWRVVHEFIFREDQARVREHRLQIAPRRLLHVGDDKAAHVDDGPIVVSIPQP
ncbi:MAG TPA: vWA domain-containing protein, partial [Pirellulales bacterium]|nr:vWA domain-containing protein [Pirellulales bacterium]